MATLKHAVIQCFCEVKPPKSVGSFTDWVAEADPRARYCIR